MPHCGVQMLMLPFYPARLKAAKQQSQNKKLFSEIVIHAFRCSKMYPERIHGVVCGLDHCHKAKQTYTTSDEPIELLVQSHRAPLHRWAQPTQVCRLLCIAICLSAVPSAAARGGGPHPFATPPPLVTGGARAPFPRGGGGFQPPSGAELLEAPKKIFGLN